MTVLRVNTIAGIGTTTFGPTFGGNLEFNSQNYIVLPKGSSTQQGVLRETVDVVGTGGTFYNNLVLAMPFNQANGLRDVSSRNRNPAAYGNVSISSTISKYYGSSAYFDGDGDYIGFSTSGDWSIGHSDFTIEFWVYRTNSGARTWLMAQTDPTATTYNNWIEFNADNTIEWQDSASGILASTGTISSGSWNHAAIVRNGTNLTWYINGSASGSGTVSNTTPVINSSQFSIGRLGEYTAGTYFNGYLQDFRIYKGIAKYTANFTPPDRIAEVGVGFTTGQLRYNTDSNLPELYDGNQWVQLSVSQVGLGTGGDTEPGARGLFQGGVLSPALTNSIEYINISSTGNSQDFGDLTQIRNTAGACASSTRGICAGGITPTPAPAYVNTIDYVTISSTGNAQDFGDLNSPVRRILSGCSSSTRGLFGGGYQGPGVPAYNIIDYITISATGNAVDFGDLTVGRYGLASFSSPVRGVWAGGYGAPLYRNTIDYVTISTLGNAFDFGDVGIMSYYLSGCSNSTRGIYAEGYSGPLAVSVNTISYVTIASTGNGVKFGDLTIARRGTSSCSSPTRGVFSGGYTNIPSYTNTIDYVSIMTQGNAVDFGDLIGGNYGFAAGCSNAHGGL